MAGRILPDELVRALPVAERRRYHREVLGIDASPELYALGIL